MSSAAMADSQIGNVVQPDYSGATGTKIALERRPRGASLQQGCLRGRDGQDAGGRVDRKRRSSSPRRRWSPSGRSRRRCRPCRVAVVWAVWGDGWHGLLATPPPFTRDRRSRFVSRGRDLAAAARPESLRLYVDARYPGQEAGRAARPKEGSRYRGAQCLGSPAVVKTEGMAEQSVASVLGRDHPSLRLRRILPPLTACATASLT